MKQIFIEFTRPSCRKFPIYSWLIRKIEGTPYSHVRIRWISGAGVELIYEAAGSKVRLIGELAQSKYPVEVIHSFRYEVTNEDYSNLIKLFRYAGVDYGLLQALGIVAVRLFGLSKNPFSRGRNSQVCSELAGLVIEEVLGYDLDINLDIAGPKDIYNYLKGIKDDVHSK